MSKNIKLVFLLLVICLVLFVFPLLFIKNSEFSGADGAARDMISEVNPDYIPWAENMIVPPGSETESLLFGLQASIGSLIIGFGFGYLVARKKNEEEKQSSENE